MIKICPRCKKKNPPRALECDACGRDITKVPVVDEENFTEEPKAEPESPASTDRLSSYRLCECGHKNPIQLRKCEQCGESLAGINITREQLLCSVEDGFQLSLAPGETILGREHTGSAYFSTKPYVGRRHAKITVESDGVYLEDLNSTNGTYINGVKIPAKTRVRIDPDEIIGLGGNAVSQKQAAFLMYASDMGLEKE
jgi:ribosomal protein L40E